MFDHRGSVETRTHTPFPNHFDDQIHQPCGSREIQEGKLSPFVQWRRVRTVSATEEYQLTKAPFTEEKWYDWIVELFKRPSAEKLAYREYEEARRTVLQCQRMRDYYDNMVKFESQRIRRLRKMLQIDEE